MASLEEDLTTDGHLERLHAALVAALRRTRAAPFDQPVTVAEIYQDLVPYRSVRTGLGFEMNADYEHTLLRLLSGEGELARLDPPEAADELRDELDSPNPNVGLFRKFAGCDVVITPLARGADAAPAAGEEASPAGPAEAVGDRSASPPDRADAGHGGGKGPLTGGLAYEPVAVTQPASAHPGDARASDSPINNVRTSDSPTSDARTSDSASRAPGTAGTNGRRTGDAAPAGGAAAHPRDAAAAGAHAASAGDAASVAGEADVAKPAEPVAETADDSEEPEYELVPVQRRTGAHASGEGHCGFCDSALPRHRDPRFCPYCGMDQSHLPCASCGEAIETGWRFCVACGAAAPAVQ